MLPVIQSEDAFSVAFPPEKVWPILSKTDWVNRAIGLPPVQYDFTPEASGGASVRARTRLFGTELRWIEFPFEWLENEYYSVRRQFEGGPLAEARLGMQFAPQGRGTLITTRSEIHPRNRLGGLIARHVLGPRAARRMGEVIRHVERFLKDEAPLPMPNLRTQEVSPTGLDLGIRKLRETGQPPELVTKLAELLQSASDIELAAIRPLGLARKWQRTDWEILRLLLHAARAGLVDLSWEVLCPNCRSSPTPAASSLASVATRNHCDACQIAFDADFDQSVELKFVVNSSLRPVAHETFCLAGPGTKPHVLSQIYLAPNESRLWKIPVIDATVRLRSPQVAHSLVLTSDELARLGSSQIVIGKEHFKREPSPSPTSDENARCAVHNHLPHPVLLILERLTWDGDILTAARVANWQEFRDLFAREIISPREQIRVGQQIVLFTDLLGSTALYNEIGDAPAYAVVRDHFTVLFQAVRDYHGAIVKTIGDAVMAVFSQMPDALHAVEQMHAQLATLADSQRPGHSPLLKSSLHLGPCLAVNANDRLDYFGTTINLAARMVSCCQGGDVTVSPAVYEHPDAVRFIAEKKLKALAAEVNFRGFNQAHRVWRIRLI